MAIRERFNSKIGDNMNSAREAQLRSWDLIREAQGLPSLVPVKEIHPAVTDLDRRIAHTKWQIEAYGEDENKSYGKDDNKRIVIFLNGRLSGLEWAKKQLAKDNGEQINYISRFVEHLRTYNVHLKSSYQGVPEDIHNKELRSFIQTFLDEENNIGERPAKPRRISPPRR